MFWYSNQQCQLRERGLFSASLSFTRDVGKPCQAVLVHAGHLRRHTPTDWLTVRAVGGSVWQPPVVRCSHLTWLRLKRSELHAPCWPLVPFDARLHKSHEKSSRIAEIYIPSTDMSFSDVVLMIKSQKQDTPKHLRSFLIIITFSSILTALLHTAEPQRQFCWIRNWMRKNREILHTVDPSYSFYLRCYGPEPSTVNKWKCK